MGRIAAREDRRIDAAAVSEAQGPQAQDGPADTFPGPAPGRRTDGRLQHLPAATGARAVAEVEILEGRQRRKPTEIREEAAASPDPHVAGAGSSPSGAGSHHRRGETETGVVSVD